MQSYSIYLDDLRTPVKSYGRVARSCDEAIDYVKVHGMPSFISFDYDLGYGKDGKLQKNGYHFAKWIVKMVLSKQLELPADFSYKVHSQNPIGKKKIEALMESFFIKILVTDINVTPD